ncbi:Calcium uptake protein 3, mitochondrial [Microtus ochrogaster]|uniref:Calcium uptake protein 3, mitochondrial n=1 Tax=Microtus ochrogaster TaxID=79684 RepID=A0A8J6GEN4_MICOH|nr:Calcium uptake protein 3, mitochondrial [Microtus ochrogaster]
MSLCFLDAVHVKLQPQVIPRVSEGRGAVRSRAPLGGAPGGPAASAPEVPPRSGSPRLGPLARYRGMRGPLATTTEEPGLSGAPQLSRVRCHPQAAPGRARAAATVARQQQGLAPPRLLARFQHRPSRAPDDDEGAVAEAAWRRRRWGELSIAAAAGGGLVGLVCYQLYGDPRAEPSELAAPEPEDPPRARGLLPIPVAAAKETGGLGGAGVTVTLDSGGYGGTKDADSEWATFSKRRRSTPGVPVHRDAAKMWVATGRAVTEDLDLYATSRERRFRLFASIECEGQLFMTPYDFILAVTTDEPKFAKTWKSLSKQELSQMLSETPPVWKGSSKLFRNLKEREPHAGFRIAFNMFDTDGNEMVDKKEFLVLQEIFRKKNEKRENKGDEEKRALLVLKTDAEEFVSRSYWDTLRRNTSQALFSDLAERADDITSLVADTTLLVHFFGKKGKAELNFEDFYRFMDNLQTEVLEIEFLSYSNGMNTISEEDFAHILLRYTNVENTSVFLENVRYSIPEEKGITFDEFRSFFQFLNNLEDFAIALNMYNFASRSIGQDEFKRAVYVATGLKLSPHLVNTIFKIFDVDKDDQLSYKEFIGIMKDRLHRGFRVSLKISSLLIILFKSKFKKNLCESLRL